MEGPSVVQVVPCAHCREPLLLPDGVSMQARLECPKCAEQFVLEQMLREQLPCWVVVQDPAGVPTSTSTSSSSASSERSTPTESPSEAIEPQSQAGERNSSWLASGVTSEAGAEAELVLADEDRAGSNPAPKTNWSEVKPFTHAEYERKKRKARSPIWSILQVALGGLAAIPIALLILWYGLGKDIAGAGPAVARYAPWIVPERFRPLPRDSANAAQEGQEDWSAPGRRPGAFRKFDEVLPTEGADSSSGDLGDPTTASMDLAEATGDGVEAGLPTELSEAEHAGAAAGEPGRVARGTPMDDVAASHASSPDAAVGSDSDLKGGEMPGEHARVFALIHSCEQNLDRWAIAYSDKSSELKKVAQDVYADLVDLAQTLEDLPTAAPGLRVMRDAMQPIGRTVKRRQDVRQLIVQGAQFWLGQHLDGQPEEDPASMRPPFGLAAIVELAEVEEQDDAWIVRPTEATAIAEVERVTIPVTLAPALIPGQRLLLLGTVRPMVEAGDSTAPSTWQFSACYLHAL